MLRPVSLKREKATVPFLKTKRKGKKRRRRIYFLETKPSVSRIRRIKVIFWVKIHLEDQTCVQLNSRVILLKYIKKILSASTLLFIFWYVVKVVVKVCFIDGDRQNTLESQMDALERFCLIKVFSWKIKGSEEKKQT